MLKPIKAPVDTHAQLQQGQMPYTGPFTAPGEQGGDTTPVVSFTNLFKWPEWESNRQPSDYWTTHSNH